MKVFLITLISVCGALILISLILFAIACLIKKAAFGSRCDNNPLLKYFTAEDFGLTAEQVDIACVKGEYVRGVIYKKEEVTPRKELVIFCHGMGPGHIAYTTEIAYLCNLGFTVLAPDYIGCNLSDGKKIAGFHSGRNSVVKAINYARKTLNHDGEIYLVGHSWGAYSALCAASITGEVQKVVAISGPDKAEKAITAAVGAQLSKFFSKILYPFISVCCSDKSAAAEAEKCKGKILLIHGEKDTVVPPDNAVYYKANGEHITKYLVQDRRHNPYNTVKGEEKLAELSANLADFKNGKVSEEYFRNFDFTAATEEDGEVMTQIAQFLSYN